MKLLLSVFLLMFFGAIGRAQETAGESIIKASENVLTDTLSSGKEKQEIATFAKQQKDLLLSSIWDCEKTFELAHELSNKLMGTQNPREALLATHEFLDSGKWDRDELVVRQGAYDTFLKVAKIAPDLSETTEVLKRLQNAQSGLCKELQQTFEARNKKLLFKVQRLRTQLQALGPGAVEADFAYQELESALNSRAKFMSRISNSDKMQFGSLAPFVIQSRLDKSLNDLLQVTDRQNPAQSNQTIKGINRANHSGATQR